MKTINLHIPTSWNDLNPRQLKNIAYFLDKGFIGKKLDLLVFFTLLNVKWFQLRKSLNALLVLKNVPLSEIAKHFSFIHTKTNLTTFIPLNSSLFQGEVSAGRRGSNLSPPADRLGNITIDELAHADDAFLKYSNTKNIEYLRLLAAILYRETVAYGLRQTFVKEELTHRLISLKKADTKTLLAIMRSYQGCRLHIISKYPKIFPKPVISSAVEKPKTKNPKSSQFSKIILELTGGKFGNYKETAATNLYLFFADFTDKIIKQNQAS